MINCTLALNQGIAGSGGAGGAGGYGGRNGGNGAPGSPGPSGGAIGGLTAGGIGSTVWNTILASNSPGGNSSGAIRDTGHNLSSDASCNFTNVGSLNNTDPKLGPLTTNGGPTVTMALLPGSLAIDAGDNSGAPTTDQRGFPRPVGPAVDIGAYERCYVPVLAISPSATGLDITARSDVGQSCRLLSSTNMSHWFPIGTNQLGENGTVVFHDNCGSGAACRFYRLVMP
jgi:hypothetical protein